MLVVERQKNVCVWVCVCVMFFHFLNDFFQFFILFFVLLLFPNKQRMTEHRTIRKLNRKNIVIHIMGKFPSYSTENIYKKSFLLSSLALFDEWKTYFSHPLSSFCVLASAIFLFPIVSRNFFKIKTSTRREKHWSTIGEMIFIFLSSLFRTINNEQKRLPIRIFFFSVFPFFRVFCCCCL